MGQIVLHVILLSEHGERMRMQGMADGRRIFKKKQRTGLAWKSGNGSPINNNGSTQNHSS
jgi:hypothetical protein